MSFSFNAAGRRDDVVAQLATVKGDSLATEIAELISRHVSDATEHVYGDENGTERALGYFVKVNGHSGHGTQPSLNVSLEPVYLVVLTAPEQAAVAGQDASDQPQA